MPGDDNNPAVGGLASHLLGRKVCSDNTVRLNVQNRMRTLGKEHPESQHLQKSPLTLVFSLKKRS